MSEERKKVKQIEFAALPPPVLSISHLSKGQQRRGRRRNGVDGRVSAIQANERSASRILLDSLEKRRKRRKRRKEKRERLNFLCFTSLAMYTRRETTYLVPFPFMTHAEASFAIFSSPSGSFLSSARRKASQRCRTGAKREER